MTISQQTGIPEPIVIAVGILEIIVATLLLAGGLGKEVLIRLAGLILVILMVIAINMAFPNGFNMMNQGYEFQLLVLVTGLYFLVGGNNV